MSVGSLKTLLTTLQASALLAAAGVTVAFGEESLVAYDKPLPLVVMVPVGGPWEGPGYYLGADQDQDGTWLTQENVDFYVFAATGGGVAIDQADAVETTRALLVQAIQQQQDSGLKWAPVSGAWVTAQDELARYGRAYRLTVQMDVSIPGVAPVDATVTTVTQTTTI